MNTTHRHFAAVRRPRTPLRPRVGIPSRKSALLRSMLPALALAIATSSALAQPPPTTTRVSVSTNGNEGNHISRDVVLSGDARYVAFTSFADNLVAGDTNGASDVFLRDRLTGATRRVSVADNGDQAYGASSSPSLAADGRLVAFQSAADNLVALDRNQAMDVFVFDRITGRVRRVSVASDGAEGNDKSELPALSANGRFVAFRSAADNLVPGDTNGVADAFVHELGTGKTTRVSVANDGTEGNGISELAMITAQGRYVAFHSLADNLVPGDGNGTWDAFVHDRLTGVTIRVSVAGDGTEGNDRSFLPRLSADGRIVVFFSEADNLVPGDANGLWDVFVHEVDTRMTSRVSVSSRGAEGDGHSGYPSISANGYYVAFDSQASNLVPGDTNGVEDVFVHDLTNGRTARVSVGPDEAQADNRSEATFLSADGRCVSFTSYATNLVQGDTNDLLDAFVRERWPGAERALGTVFLPWVSGAGSTSNQLTTNYLPWASGHKK